MQCDREPMIFFSVGLPSRFTDWCEGVTRALSEHALGPTGLINVTTVDEFAVELMRIEEHHIVACSREIGRLQTILTQAKRPPIVTLDHPYAVVQLAVERYGMTFLDGLRAAARSCAALVGSLGIPHALVLNAERDATHPMTTAQAICRHFELALTEVQIAVVLDQVAQHNLSPTAELDPSWWDTLDDASRRLAEGALDPYRAHFAGAELGPITWERELFFINEEQPADQLQSAARPIDITGRSRVLIHGPYIGLPAGNWSAKVALGFSKEAAETSFVVDVHGDRLLAEVDVSPPSEGLVEVDLPFTIDGPIDQYIMVRVWNRRAAFDGRLALGHVTLTPQTQLRRETREYLATALAS